MRACEQARPSDSCCPHLHWSLLLNGATSHSWPQLRWRLPPRRQEWCWGPWGAMEWQQALLCSVVPTSAVLCQRKPCSIWVAPSFWFSLPPPSLIFLLSEFNGQPSTDAYCVTFLGLRALVSLVCRLHSAHEQMREEESIDMSPIT